jgi:hypothetical protein
MAPISLNADSSELAARTASDPLFGIRWFWVVLLCAALLAGPAYNTFLHYDFSHTPDCLSYAQMARGNFDVIVTHKYRIVVPLLARAVNMPLEGVYRVIWSHRNFDEARLRFAFFLVNLTLMSLTGLVLFRTCQAYGLGTVAAAVGVAGLLSSRWANYAASLPMVDSFHWLCVSLVFLAIKTKSGRMLALAILMGPLSKESFVFIVPATLLFGNLRLTTQVVLYALSASVVLAVHFFIDLSFPMAGVGSVQNSFNHLGNIADSLKRIFSPGGIGEVFSLLGLFNVFWLLAVFQAHGTKVWQTIDKPLIFLLASALFQALISTSIVRMLFVAAPLWAVVLGKGFEQWQTWLTGTHTGAVKDEKTSPVDGPLADQQLAA